VDICQVIVFTKYFGREIKGIGAAKIKKARFSAGFFNMGVFSLRKSLP
jgi:hypothetical protein